MAQNQADLVVNVMMIGGRRCGKTTVLAAMQECFEKQCEDTPLVIKTGGGSLEAIEEKQREIKQFFSNPAKSKEFTPDINPTEHHFVYPFDIGLKGKRSQIRVKFIDFPGEWIKDKNPSHEATLLEDMEDSRILVVAIDTPHMMEANGHYNDNWNRCWKISQMVKEVEFADPDKGPGMILFVPLKCEKYYNGRKMGKVVKAVQEAYGPLLSYLKQPTADGRNPHIMAAITPILTMGCAVFSRFQTDADGRIEENEEGNPKKAIYQFTDMRKNRPEPKYCEQPLLYVLDYLLSQAENARRKEVEGWWNSIVGWFQENLFNWPAAGDYLSQKEVVQRKMIQDEDGYVILHR